MQKKFRDGASEGFAHLLLIVIVMVAAFAGLFFYSWQRGLINISEKYNTTENSESAETIKTGWEKFTVDEYNLEFQYPADLEIFSYEREGYQTFEFGNMPFYKNEMDYNMDGYGISLSIYPELITSAGYKSLHEYDKDKECEKDIHNRCSDILNTHIAGRKAQMTRLDNTSRNRKTNISTYYFEKEGVLFVVNIVSSYPVNYQGNFGEVDTMLNSIRFTDAKPDTMATYSDKEFNIRFTHPDYWKVSSYRDGGEGTEPFWVVHVNAERLFSAEILKEDNPQNLNPEDWFDKEKSSRYSKYIEKITYAEIDSKPALVIGHNESCRTAAFMVVFIQDKNFMYRITYFNTGEDSKDVELNTILKQFKFVEEGRNSAISNNIPKIEFPSVPTGINCDN